MTETEFQKAAAEIFAPVIAEYDVPGLAVGLTWQGRDYVYTTGMADRAADKPVTDKTLFELGSISKTFNVALAALAEQQGHMSLSDPASVRLPDLKDSALGAVTLMDLATHQTGGLPLQVPDEAQDDSALMRWLQTWQPVPGAGERSYSNISIGLLGRASAEAFGGDYTTVLRDQILHPMGLENTYVDVPQAQMPQYAFGYSRKDDSPVRVNPGVLDSEAYGLKSNLRDMLRFLQINLGDVKIPPELQDSVAKTHAAQTRTRHFDQAMIWERYPWPVPREQLLAGNAPEMVTESQPATRLAEPETSDQEVLFSKTGSTNGFGGYVAFIPDKDLGLVILSNRNVPLPARVDAGLTLIESVLEMKQ
ncbi:class C beta-lactamase [Paracoccus onubensis]|uniref:class C beta-lactamase n=1 Tax=Paracoccus onubensis TaxID=1675788 RepID=UPI0027314D76|nr:class C beta-lactamase [Paracoccus onubensis]MDP0926316.1 class C beta-lactamase [Paracoccus onubensis]